MNRLGIAPADTPRLAERLERCGAVAVLRLMTHLARADEDDGVADALARFDAACRGLPFPRSIANSAGVVRHAEVGGDIVRPGIMLYGATPFASRSAETIGVAPVMTLHSAIIAVQTLRPNDSVGYGASFTAARTVRIGVVACGYADGYPRHAANGTPVLVCGKKVRIVGRVSMDMITVDLTGVPEAHVGSPVVLWGRGLPVDDVASAAATVGYELLCAVAPRVPFVVSNVGPIDLEI
jgi:alanine racemase